MTLLSKVHIEGFKSIAKADLELTQLDVVLGINASGKSNLMQFFQMLNFITTQSLQLFVNERAGGPDSLLHHGSQHCARIRGHLEFQADKGTNHYGFDLVPAAGDTLIFSDEWVRFDNKQYSTTGTKKSLSSGQKETNLRDPTLGDDITAKLIRVFLSETRAYQFHDTSFRSSIRLNNNIQSGTSLFSNAGNLADVLYTLQQYHSKSFQRLSSAIKQAVPHFDQFVLIPHGPEEQFIRLQWTEKGTSTRFQAHQASDGMLRLIALATLLCTPDELRPSLVAIDEPELGLHPRALHVLADLIIDASSKTQLLLSTQSMELVKLLNKDPIICVRDVGKSQISRRAPFQVDEYLDEYTVGEQFESR